MQSQPKAKQKHDVQKGLNYLSSIIPANSQIRQQIDNEAQITNQRVQTIHKLQTDTRKNRQFICTEVNRHKSNMTSFRSPYSNTYFPQTQQDNGTYFPSPILRDMEEKGNILFQQYTKLYYGEAVGNFFVYDAQEGLNVVFCVRKDYADEDMKGVWSSTNFIQIRGDPQKSATYKLSTSILYDINLKIGQNDSFLKVSGSLKKNKADAKKPLAQYEIDEFHLMMCGKLVEQTQTLLRQQLESIFLNKSKQICFKNRYIGSRAEQQAKIKMGKQFVKLRAETNRVVQ